MPKNEPYFIKAEQGEGKDHSIIYLDSNGLLTIYPWKLELESK